MEKGLQYTASALGLAMVAMMVAFAIGEGVPNLLNLSAREQGQFASMALMVLGALTALKWAHGGGALILVGFVLFQAVEWQANRHLATGPILIFALAGLLHVVRPTRPLSY